MMSKVRKIRVKDPVDSSIIDECKKEIRLADYEAIEWFTPSKGVQLCPPPHTLAIVVDVISNQGAIRIFTKESGEYIDGVGTEEKGYRIIVPWHDDWRIRVSGNIDIGYLRLKDAD
ncbi:uncharacterized protein BDW70DRAFT_139442 [Aspergillus foveolatus]|uniref:uncharacterized protein n=1 Tax=Aspergillus foveolatus TaxID=210207 RepID=UPI003CCCD1FA